MRVLFTTWAWPSPLPALVPLARACQIGHEVLVASQPALVPAVAAAGLPYVSVGHDVDAVARLRALVSGTGPPLPGAVPPGSAAHSRAGDRPRVLDLFVDIARAMTGDLIDWASAWLPDLVVFEPTTLAGPIVARAVGGPAARQVYGPDLIYPFPDVLTDACRVPCGRVGLPGIDPAGGP